MTQQEKPKTNPFVMLGGIAGAGVGYFVGSYAWNHLLIPGLTAIVVAAILAKVVSADRKPFVGAIAVQTGHLMWFIFGAAFTGAWNMVAIDVVVLGVGLTWLIIRPGIIPILICGIYQVVGLSVNATTIANAPYGSVTHRALTVHITLHLLAIILLITGWLMQRRQRAAAQALIAVGASPAGMTATEQSH